MTAQFMQRQQPVTYGRKHLIAMGKATSRAIHSDQQHDVRVVHVVDDDHKYRKSLIDLLESVDLRVNGHASPIEFLNSFDEQRAGCIVLDIRMPGMSGLEVHEHLLSRNVATPVIFLTGHGEVGIVVQAMKNGAVEVFEKTVSEQDLLDAVQAAVRSEAERQLHVESVRRLLARFQQLTPREQEILAQVATGRSSQQIADHLQGLKRKTVETHRASIMRKMKAPNVAGLVRMYFDLRRAGAVKAPSGYDELLEQEDHTYPDE